MFAKQFRSISTRRTGRRAALALIGAGALVTGITAATAAAGASGSQPQPTGAQPQQAGTFHAAKSITGRLAQSDPAVLKLTGTKPTSVMVKLDYDALASYTGTISGYPATSPQVTHKALNPKSAASAAYLGYVRGIQNSFTSALHQAVPAAVVGDAYQGVYGGVEVTAPAGQISKLLSLPGVAAVQADSLHKLDATQVTDDDASYIGAQTAYNALGSSATAGKGVIIADVDTGVWPEHPSFANRSDLSAPPPTADGHPRACNFGTDPLTHVAFTCNDKLIEGQVFLDTYNALNNDELYPTSARDSNGHGTHTTSTAGGNPLAHATLFGVDRGPIQGIAPGAWLMSYKALGPGGGYDADLVGAIEQAIYDGANVISYSVGPSSPQSAYSAPDDLAFLDAFDAGVVVSTSAGNSGPGAQTVSHNGPWELSTGATTLSRAFTSTASLHSTDGASLTENGSSIMPGISTPTPVVSAASAPYSDAVCGHAAPAGTFTGKIVICVRGGVDAHGAALGRVQKGYNVLQGGAAGMFLVNPVPEDTETDNHFLPAVHFDQPAGSQVQAFVAGHPNVTATFTTGTKTYGQGDVMAAFSSRGPGGDGYLKPDIAAPGVQILAGNTPTPTDIASGPSGQLFQAIAGTSMAAPHISGSAALVLALHPTMTPAEVMSVLMSTATTNVVKQDGTTPATPFDDGAGRVDLNNVVSPGVALNVTPAQMDSTVTDTVHRIDLNTASVYDAALPGRVTTTRTFTNVGTQTQVYKVSATSTLAGGVTVSPSTISVPAGGSRAITVTLDGSAGTVGSTYFGQINLTPVTRTQPQHLPVAFTVADATAASTAVSVTSNCAPSSIALASTLTTCSATVVNHALQNTQASATMTPTLNLQTVSVGAGGTRSGRGASFGPVNLSAATPPIPHVATGDSPAGFLDLNSFPGNLVIHLGDENLTNVNGFGSFVYDGQSYSSVGISSDGYLVAGGGDNNDVSSQPQTMPDPARPNNVLAPFWTDLDDGNGTITGQHVLANILGDGVNNWLIIQWDTHVFGSPSTTEHFQVWLGLNGTQDISYTYGALHAPGVPLNIGAENADGTEGSNVSGLPTGDLVVTSSDPVPGGQATFSATLRGVQVGTGSVEWDVTSPAMRDTAISRSTVTVTKN